MRNSAHTNETMISPRPSVFAFMLTGRMKKSRARRGISGYAVVKASNKPQTEPDAPISSEVGGEKNVCSRPPAIPERK